MNRRREREVYLLSFCLAEQVYIIFSCNCNLEGIKGFVGKFTLWVGCPSGYKKGVSDGNMILKKQFILTALRKAARKKMEYREKVRLDGRVKSSLVVVISSIIHPRKT